MNEDIERTHDHEDQKCQSFTVVPCYCASCVCAAQRLRRRTVTECSHDRLGRGLRSRPKRCDASLVHPVSHPSRMPPEVKWSMSVERIVGRSSSADTRKFVLVCIAVLLFVLEVLQVRANASSSGGVQILLSSSAIVVALAATGFFVLPGGIAVVALAVAQNVFVSGATMGMLAVYVVVALWISRGMWLPSTLALILAEGSALIWSTKPEAQILSLALGTSITIIVGLLIRNMTRRNKVLESDLKEVKEQSEKALAALRLAVNTRMHDDVATRLVAISSLAEQIEPDDGVSKEDLDLLKSLITESLTSVRAVIRDYKTVDPKTLLMTVSEVQTMLTARSMTLEVDVSGVSGTVLDNREPLLPLVIWEGCANAFKYGREGSAVNVVIEETQEDRVTTTIKNVIATEESGDDDWDRLSKRVSGGYGLRNLETQINASGGQLATWTVESAGGSTWILMAELPASAYREYVAEPGVKK